MILYNGSRDLIADPTTHTAALVSTGIVTNATQDGPHREVLTLREHGRKDWSLFFCVSGRLIFGRDEQQVLREKEFWIYPPNTPHYYFMGAEETCYRYLHFTGACIDELVDELELPLCAPSPAAPDFDPHRLERLEHLYASGTARQTDLEWRLLHLLSTISAPADVPRDRTLMSAILEEMENRYFEPFDAGFYAGRLGISISRFNHLFKATVGVSPLQYYTGIRIANAARLLKYTELPVQKIALSVGYEDPLYFDRVFKKKMHTTPKAYRKDREE